MASKKVIIIGAGIGGLGLANIMAKAGYDVHVYEKDSGPGGRAGLLQLGEYTFDTGPSWYLMPGVFEHYYDLIDEPIASWLDLHRLSPAYKVFFEKHDPVVVSSSIEEGATLFESIEPGAGESLRRYVTKGDKIYQLSLKHFLYSNFTSISDFLRWNVLSNGILFLRLILRPIDSYVSSFVRDQRLKQILEYPMVFLGTSPFGAPALYSLMSSLDFREGVFYPKGGLYAIIQSLQIIGKKLGVSYHYNSDVISINSENGAASGVMLASGERIEGDIVVSNADLHFTETKLVEPQYQTYPEQYWKNKQAGPSALLLYIGVEGLIPEFKHHNLLFVEQWRENFDAIYNTKTPPDKASIYISKASETDDTVAPNGHESVFVLVPLPAGISINAAELETLKEHYLHQINTMTGVDLAARTVESKTFGPDDFETKFHSWQSSMLGQSHILRQSAFFRTSNKSKKLKNLYYVGSGTTPGIGLPMCLISAELVYKRIIGSNKGGRVTHITHQQESEI